LMTDLDVMNDCIEEPVVQHLACFMLSSRFMNQWLPWIFLKQHLIMSIELSLLMYVRCRGEMWVETEVPWIKNNIWQLDKEKQWTYITAKANQGHGNLQMHDARVGHHRQKQSISKVQCLGWCYSWFCVISKCM
jgi:hypothetical protein